MTDSLFRVPENRKDFGGLPDVLDECHVAGLGRHAFIGTPERHPRSNKHDRHRYPNSNDETPKQTTTEVFSFHEVSSFFFDLTTPSIRRWSFQFDWQSAAEAIEPAITSATSLPSGSATRLDRPDPSLVGG